MSELPHSLVEEIRAGRCIAFVGAGFAGAAGLPTWTSLLEILASKGAVSEPVREHVRALIKRGSAHAFDEAAQTLEDVLTREGFTSELRQQLGSPAPTNVMLQRLRWLQGIPFRAILTTNFDGLLEGRIPCAESYRNVLRPKANAWWESVFWQNDAYRPPLIKIHGDVRTPSSIVLTRRDYRRLLYSDPGYREFLRAVLAQHTVLYLGFSFSDAYLNEIRSETLALLGHGVELAPVAYALVNDMPELTRQHYRKYEGIEVLSYDTGGGKDHSGFDRLLKEIHDYTNPVFHFGRLLMGRRVLWVDPHHQNNQAVHRFFMASKLVAEVAPGSLNLELCDTADTALQRLSSANAAGIPYDLIISHWGQCVGEQLSSSPGERLLQGLRAQDVRCPVIIFSESQDVETRKRRALGLGAQGYCFTYEALLQTIERVLSPGVETR